MSDQPDIMFMFTDTGTLQARDWWAEIRITYTQRGKGYIEVYSNIEDLCGAYMSVHGARDAIRDVYGLRLAHSSASEKYKTRKMIEYILNRERESQCKN